jgi:hypothetical protein
MEEEEIKIFLMKKGYKEESIKSACNQWKDYIERIELQKCKMC